ncbi:MAG: NAD-dependent epimerase/dehydratase family protein [Hyphomicrobiaceae bacterium]|nr:NAD-dependent epimerase/dehydratase family protein [Hyphomicrobiaceae bacterium]
MNNKIEGEKILITGGAGFIGTALIRTLIAKNEIVVFDNMRRDALSGSELSSHSNLKTIEGDVLDRDQLNKAISGSTYIVHCAGIAGIRTVVKSPTLTMRVNMVGTANVLAAAVERCEAKRVVCFSTSEVFGEYAMGAVETDKSVIGAAGEARWTYAVSKLAEEHLAMAYNREFGLPTSVVRPFNIYGPGQVGEGALRTFIKRALRNEPIEVHGEGTQIRAWCYVDDMVEGTRLTMAHPKAIGESFNIGNHRSVETINGLANMVVRVLHSKSEIRYIERPSADVELRIPSVGKARELLGFEARIGLEDGIKRTAEYYRK